MTCFICGNPITARQSRMLAEVPEKYVDVYNALYKFAHVTCVDRRIAELEAQLDECRIVLEIAWDNLLHCKYEEDGPTLTRIGELLNKLSASENPGNDNQNSEDDDDSHHPA